MDNKNLSLLKYSMNECLQKTTERGSVYQVLLYYAILAFFGVEMEDIIHSTNFKLR